jgi:hypothetical protein
MKEYGLVTLFEPADDGDGAGAIRDFNDNEFAIRIAGVDFEQAMNIASQRLGRAKLSMLNGKKYILLTDFNGIGTAEALGKHLTEIGVSFSKIPRLPKAQELSGYCELENEGGYWWKPLPVGFGFHDTFRCLELGVPLTEDGELLYRVRDWHQRFLDGNVLRIKGEVEYRDLFGCCLHAWYGNVAKATILAKSKYLKWGRHAAFAEADAQMMKAPK